MVNKTRTEYTRFGGGYWGHKPEAIYRGYIEGISTTVGETEYTRFEGGNGGHKLNRVYRGYI